MFYPHKIKVKLFVVFLLRLCSYIGNYIRISLYYYLYKCSVRVRALTVSALDEKYEESCLPLSREDVEYTSIDVMTVHLVDGNNL